MRRGNDLGRARAAVAGLVLASLIAAPARAAEPATCPDGRRPIYLTFDTGSESQAVLIHDILRKHDVRATFFLANEKTDRGDWSLDKSWAPFWKKLADEGHAFGSHTFDHVYYRGDTGATDVSVRPQFGAQANRVLRWTPEQYCKEIGRVATRFKALTGNDLDRIWRAPGGRTSTRLLAIGDTCGYRHFGWSPAGFVGDELPSDRYPNAMLLDRALTSLKGGDIVLMHLGIRSRKEPLAPILDPLIAGLKARGHCFATLRAYPPEKTLVTALAQAGSLLAQGFNDVLGWVFQAVVEPVLFQLDGSGIMEQAYDGTELFLLGVVQVAVLYLLLRPLESLRPAERWSDRRATRVDVVYTLLHRLGLFSLVLFFVLDPLFDWFASGLRLNGISNVNLDDLWPGVTSIPLVAFAIYLVVLDFANYWIHRLQHRLRWWWALHSLHHSQRQMSFWSDDRNHLLDDLLRDAIFAALAVVIGVQPGQFVLLLMAQRSLESLQHANLRLSFGRFGERLLVSPRFHRRHHAIGDGHEGAYRGCNFAVLFPVWDVLFRTANFEVGYPATGIRDQLPDASGKGRDYGSGFWSQQWLGLKRMVSDRG